MLFEQPHVNGGIPAQPDPPDLARCRDMTIGMVTNPRSGGNKKRFGTIRGVLARNPEIHHGEGVTSSEVQGVLADFASKGVNLLVVNGGDGTVQSVLTTLYVGSFFPAPPVLALLQAGTTSMLSRDVGVRGAPAAALAKILTWNPSAGGSHPSVFERPVLKISQTDGSEPICGMFFGAGAIPQGIDLWHTGMNPKGVRGELLPGLIIARFLLAALTGNGTFVPATHMEIRLDAAPPRENAYLFAMISTLERLFLGLRPFWGTEAAPLHFTALKANPPYLRRNLPYLLRGRRTRTASPENGFFSHNVRKITLDWKGKFTLDGEIFEAKGPLIVEPAGPARFLKI